MIRAVVAHFYVVSIHPFADGNGRTSRAVESYFLYQSGVNSRGFYSLANYYYRNRPEYIEQLNRARFLSAQDLTSFILFALKGLVEELEITHREILDEVRVIAFRDYARETLAGDGKLGRPSGDRMLQILLELLNGAAPLKDIRSGQHPASRIYRGVTTKTLTRDINHLTGLGLIAVSDGAVSANLEAMDRFIV